MTFVKHNRSEEVNEMINDAVETKKNPDGSYTLIFSDGNSTTVSAEDWHTYFNSDLDGF